MIARLLLPLLLLWSAVVVAQDVRPLTLDEVLRSSAINAPQIVEALTRVRQAEGRSLAADGAFDTVFDVDAQSRVAGYYDGSYVDGRATRPLTGNGGQLYGGYRVSRGTFPIYEDKAYTDRLGEFRVGGLFSLLRDRAIDERRADGPSSLRAMSTWRGLSARWWRSASRDVRSPLTRTGQPPG